MIVVDASVLATALGDDGPDGDRARARLRGERLNAPELVDLEVASVLRRQVQGGEVDIRRAALALADLAAFPLRRAPHRPLLARCWELRDNLTIYDASYVALAEALDVTLLTGDGRLARAPGPRCRVEMLRPASLSAASPTFSKPHCGPAVRPGLRPGFLNPSRGQPDPALTARLASPATVAEPTTELADLPLMPRLRREALCYIPGSAGRDSKGGSCVEALAGHPAGASGMSASTLARSMPGADVAAVLKTNRHCRFWIMRVPARVQRNGFDCAVQAGSFGGEDGEMAGQRFAWPGGDQLGVPGGDGGGERVHQARVAAAVALAGLHRGCRCGGDQPVGAGEEVVDADGLGGHRSSGVQIAAHGGATSSLPVMYCLASSA